MADPADIHHELIQRLTASGGALSPTSASATVNDPTRFRAPGIPTRERRQLHARILEEYFAENPDVLRDRRAVISVGPPGAGKSSAMRQLIPEHEQMLWRQIDPDDFKQRILQAEISAGTIDSLKPAGTELPPGELAALVHEESSLLADQARDLALARGERVVIDGVHGTASKIEKRLSALALAGYGVRSTTIVTVDGGWAVTRARVEHRWRTSYQGYVDGEHDGTSTRFVPEEVTAELYASRDDAASSCRTATRDVMRSAIAAELVERAQVFAVPTATSAPTLAVTYERAGGRLRTVRALEQEPAAPAAAEHAAPAAGATDAGQVWVEGYVRSDGVHVEGHWRMVRGPSARR